MKKIIYLGSLLSFLLATMAAFLYLDHFIGHPVKIALYFIWIKLQDFLLLFGYVFFTRGRMRLCICVASLFYFLRVVWQAFEMENYAAANKPYIIDWLFLLIMLTILCLLFLPIKSLNPTKKENRWN